MALDEDNIPKTVKGAKLARGALQIASGAVPIVGGFLAAVAGAWSEKDQERVNQFFAHWVRMIEDEIREKERTVAEVMARLDLQDDKINKRLQSAEYQSLIKKTFRDWAGAESEKNVCLSETYWRMPPQRR